MPAVRTGVNPAAVPELDLKLGQLSVATLNISAIRKPDLISLEMA